MSETPNQFVARALRDLRKQNSSKAQVWAPIRSINASNRPRVYVSDGGCVERIQ